jgi:hypothetical protein
MKRFLPLVALCLALAACGTTPVPPGTPAITSTISVAQGVYVAEGGYIAARRAMSAYEAGQFGKPNPAVVAKMVQADNVAYSLLVPLRAAAQSGATIAQASIDALVAAVTQFQSVNAAAGVK